MNIAVAILIVVVATAISIVAMLRVRRRAPDGSYFHDGDRAAGVFGVLATGFAVLLGLVGAAVPAWRGMRLEVADALAVR